MDVKIQRPPAERIQYTRDELYKLKEIIINIPQEIENAKAEMESELSVVEEQEWSRPTTNVQVPPISGRYLEPDNRDWKTRTPGLSPAEDKAEQQQQKDVGKRSNYDWRDREQEHDTSNLHSSARQQEPLGFNSSRQQESQAFHYMKQQENQPAVSVLDTRHAPAIMRASSPWTARTGSVSEKEKVLRTVKGILNKLTPEKFEVLLEQLINAGIDSADILKGVISLVFDKAVLEPTFCPMYAELCVHLSKALPEFTSDEDDGKPVTFRRVLLNSCQEEFEGADKLQAEIRQMTKPEQELERREKEKLVKLRTLGNIRLIGELFKQKMIPEKIVHYCIQNLLGSDPKNAPAEENVEALCQLLPTVGKQLDESTRSKNAADSYFSILKEFRFNERLPPRIRFMVRDTVELRVNKWVPRREEVKAKTINEIHAEAEQTLGLRPGMTGLRNGRAVPGVMGMPGIGNNFPISRPGSMMPGMPGLLPVSGKMPGAAPLLSGYIPGVESEGWEVFSYGRRSKVSREGLIPPPNTLPGRSAGMPVSGTVPNSTTSKLLPQGSGGLGYGRQSALLNDSAAKAGTPPIHRQGVGTAESVGQGQGHYGTAPRNAAVVLEQERVTVPLKQMAPPASSPPAALSKKSESLLKEYLSVADLNEAMLCVEELQTPDFHPEFVQMTVSMGLESQDRERELIRKLLENLCLKNVVAERDIQAGVVRVAEQLDDLALDIPKAPEHVGDLIGKLSVSGVVDLGLLVEVIQSAKDPGLKKIVYEAALKAIKSGPNSERMLSQRNELLKCERLVEIAAR